VPFHVGKLVAKRGDSEFGEIIRQFRHEGMPHSRSGAVGDHETCFGLSRGDQYSGDAGRIVDGDFQ
jgi:hypothetical protein